LEERSDRPRMPRSYANHVNVYASPFDVVLEAGVKGPPGGTAEVHTILVMSPQMAKVVSRLLDATIRQWEAKHGEINLAGQVKSGPDGGSNMKPS